MATAEYIHYRGIMVPPMAHTEESLEYAQNFPVQDTDVFAVTYPKSGSKRLAICFSWLCFWKKNNFENFELCILCHSKIFNNNNNIDNIIVSLVLLFVLLLLLLMKWTSFMTERTNMFSTVTWTTFGGVFERFFQSKHPTWNVQNSVPNEAQIKVDTIIPASWFVWGK